MTLQQIQYLEMVAKMGSISKAADALYAAQSSLSAAIKEVEKEYNITIFKRTSKGVTLTHQGTEFMGDIRYISNYHTHIDKKYKHTQREGHRFCISSLHHICGEGAFLRLIEKIKDKNYSVGYLEGNPPFVLETLDNGKSDIGMVFFTESAKGVMVQDIRRRGMLFNHISYRPMHIYVHQDHPLANKASVSMKEVAAYPFVTYDNYDPDSGKYTLSFGQWNKNAQLVYVSDRATAYAVIRLGQAYATGTGYLSADEQNNDIVSIPITDLENIEVGWLAKDRVALSELSMEYIALMKEMYA